MTLSVALVGTGVQGRGAYLPTILAHPGLSLVAIFSRTSDAACSLHDALPDALKPTVKLYSSDVPLTESVVGSFDDLLQNTEISSLIIALPIESQPEFVLAALQAGKHVLSEKPIAHNTTTARNLIHEYQSLEAQNSSLVWHVAENWRLIPAYQHAIDAVGRLGRVLGFRTRQSLMMGADSPFLTSGWRASPTFKGGLLLDGAVHGIAVLRLLLGAQHAVTRVSAFTNSLQSHLPAPDTLDAIVKTSTGVTGVMQMSYGTTFDGPVFEVACEGGVVRIDGFDTVVVNVNGKEPETTTGGGLGESVGAVVDAWVNAIHGRKGDPRLSAAEALIDLHIIQAMIQSAASDGLPVDL